MAKSKNCKVDLCFRRYGKHDVVKSCTLKSPLSQYARKIPKSDGDYIVREDKILKDLPKDFLAGADPEAILLIIKDTGQVNLKKFRNWAKYFDCYSLFLE